MTSSHIYAYSRAGVSAGVYTLHNLHHTSHFEIYKLHTAVLQWAFFLLYFKFLLDLVAKKDRMNDCASFLA